MALSSTKPTSNGVSDRLFFSTPVTTADFGTLAKRVRNGTSLRQHPILECALICLVTAAIAFFNPYMKMGGTELVYEMFSECRDDNYLDGFCPQVPSQVWPLIKMLALALLGKALITVVTWVDFAPLREGVRPTDNLVSTDSASSYQLVSSSRL